MLGLVGLQMNMSARNRTLNRRAPTPFPALQQATATTSLMKIVLNAVAVWLHLFCGEDGKVSSYIGEKQYTNGGCSRKVGALEERRWFPSYGTLTAVLPAQPAMIKYLQHVENKGSTHVKNDLRRKSKK